MSEIIPQLTAGLLDEVLYEGKENRRRLERLYLGLLQLAAPELLRSMWALLNRTQLTAFHAKSPARLLGPCDAACAAAHWQKLGAVVEAPLVEERVGDGEQLMKGSGNDQLGAPPDNRFNLFANAKDFAWLRYAFSP